MCPATARWEEAILFVLIGILLVVIALCYLHRKERIRVPAWGWALLTILLGAAALLLMVNLLPPATGDIVRPGEIVNESIYHRPY